MSTLSDVRATVTACQEACAAAEREVADAYRALVACADGRRAAVDSGAADIEARFESERVARDRYSAAIDAQRDAYDERADAYVLEFDCLNQRHRDGFGNYAD